ncbi:MAG: MerR family transcriptional regulator [Lachnospirales bacterium]
MEYYIKTLSKISGVSTRTLRYYDEIGLLSPLKVNSSKYRIYGEEELKKLQVILFYKRLGFSLDEIKSIVNKEDFNVLNSLENHLNSLMIKRQELDVLIDSVKKTILSEKGEVNMSNYEKFEAFKASKLNENEEKYGKEIREKYGNENVEKANAKFQGLTEEDFKRATMYEEDMVKHMKIAMSKGDFKCDEAMKACECHKNWLNIYWPDGLYSKEAHKNLVYMYTIDERFKKYYEKFENGFADFLYRAIEIYCS